MEPGDFEELVNVIYSLFDGAIMQAQNFMQDWPIEAASKASIKMLAQYRAP